MFIAPPNKIVHSAALFHSYTTARGYIITLRSNLTSSEWYISIPRLFLRISTIFWRLSKKAKNRPRLPPSLLEIYLLQDSHSAPDSRFFGIELWSHFVRPLELRQYKNDSIQSKIIPILKLALFFPHCLGGEKERQFQSWNYFRMIGVVLILS